jgi:hypothetical protein
MSDVQAVSFQPRDLVSHNIYGPGVFLNETRGGGFVLVRFREVPRHMNQNQLELAVSPNELTLLAPAPEPTEIDLLALELIL